MHDKEEVNENEARKLAQKIGAFFVITSGKNNAGITNLFMNAANIFVEQIYKIISGEKKDIKKSTSDKIKLGDKEDRNEKSRQCC